jgi:DNA primase
MAVAAAWQAGIKNTVAVSGTALTPEQLNIIKRYTKNIKMFFDMDEAGQKAAKRSAELAFEKEINVSIVEIENGKDAADAVKENANEFLASVKKSSSAMEYFIKKSLIKYDKNNIDDKKNIIQDLSGLVSSFANKIEKEYWIRSISEKLDVSEKILFDTFNKSEYQYKKFESEISDNKPKADPMIQDRSNNIQIQIMGLLISDNNIWKESLKRYKKEINEYFSNKKILDIISNKGREIDFNFEKLLNGIEDEKQKAYLRKLYFENIEKGEEFSSIKEKLEAVDKYFVELKKEAMKASLEDIVRRIKAAESSGKKEEVRRLTEELVDLSKQS